MKRKGWLISAFIGSTILGIGFGLQPFSEAYIGPYVQEQLHTALNGTVSYESFHVGWDGSVQVENLTVDDTKGNRVLTADMATVSIQWLHVLQYPFGNVSPDALIGTITVTAPHVNIVREADGEWNLSKLMKPRESETQSQFSGLIRLENGTVSLMMPQRSPLVLTNVNASVVGDGGHTLESVIDTTLGNDKIHGKVTLGLGETTDRSFYLESSHLELKPILESFDIVDAEHAFTGTLTDVAVTMQKRSGFWYGEGQLFFDNVGAKVDGYALQKGKGRVQIHGDVVTLQNVEAEINDEHLFLGGTVHHVFDEDPTLHLSIGLKEWSLAPFTQGQGTGYISGDAIVTGPISNVRGSADIQVHDVTYNGFALNRGTAHVVYGDQTIQISDMMAYTQGGTVTGSGLYHVEDGTYMAALSAQNLSLYQLPIDSMPQLQGVVSGDITLQGDHSGITSVQGTVSGKQVSYQSMLLNTLEGSIAWDGSTLVVPYMNGTMGSGSLTGNGQIGNGTFAVNIHGTEIGLSNVNGWSPKPLSGNVSMSVNLAGSLENPSGTLEISGKDMGFGSMKFDQALVKATMQDGRLQLTTGDVSYKNSHYQVHGSLELGGNQQIDMTAKADDVRLEEVTSNVTSMPITGWVQTELQAQGTLHSPKISGHLKAWDGSIYGKLFESIEGDYSFADGVLTLPRLEMSTYGASVIVDGKLDNRKVDINLAAKALPVGPFIRNTGVNLDGYIEAQGYLGGTVDDPIFEGAITSDELQVQKSTLHNVAGSLYMTPKVLNLQELTFTGAGNSRYEIKGGVQLDASKRIYGYAHVEDGDIHQLLSFGNANVPDINGKLRGTVDLGGTTENPRIDVKGSVVDTSIRNEVVGTAMIDATYAGRTVDIRTFTLPIKEGLIAAKGKADLDGDSDIQIVASKVPVGTVLPLVTTEVQGQGDWNFIINVNGKTKSPKVEFSSEVENPVVNGIALDQLSILGTMEDEVIYIQQGMIKKADSSIKVRGKAPLEAIVHNEYMSPDPNKQFDIYVDMNEANLSVLPLMFKGVTSADGAIRGVVHVTGTASNVLAKGTVELSEGTLKLKAMKKPFDKLKAQLVFRGNQLDLTGSTLVGKGNAGISGSMGWAANHINSYYGALQMKNLEMDHEFYTGPLDGELYMVDKYDMPTLVGTISLHDVVASIPLSFESSGESIPLGLDLTIDAGDNVRLYNPLLYDMYLQGKVKFEGTLGDPKASGQLSVRKGYLKYLKNRFKITEGQAKFVSGSIIPELNVRSMANVKSYRVSLQAEGPATQMKLKLSAEPNLSDRQIISLLTFGRNVGNTSGVTSEDANALLASGLQSLAFGYIEDVLQDSLGLDMVNITTGSLDGKDSRDLQEKNNFNVSIGKYVLPDFMVTVTRGLNNDRMAYGFQYDVNQSISATGWLDNSNRKYLGAQWRYRF